jgi:hypothetical protein
VVGWGLGWSCLPETAGPPPAEAARRHELPGQAPANPSRRPPQATTTPAQPQRVAIRPALLPHLLLPLLQLLLLLLPPQEVASALATVVFLDAQYRPKKVPPQIKEMFLGLQQQEHQHREEQQQQQQQQQQGLA